MKRSAWFTNTVRSARPVMAVALVVALLAACGSGSADEVVSEDSGTDTAASADSNESSTPVASGVDAGDTGGSKTLDEYLGSLSRAARGPGAGRGNGGDEAALEEQAQVEVEVQRCMQAEGFEYVPEEVGGGLGQFIAQANQGLSPEELAETKGFGISTRFDEVLDGDVVLEADEADPNDEYLATLSEGEQDAWQFALRGAPLERNAQGQPIDPETGDVIPGGRRQGTTGGCRATANTIVRGDRSVIESLADEFAELDARIAADPRIAEIAREWTSCMQDAGFTYETEAEARAEIGQEFRPLIREAFGRGAGAGGGRPDFSSIELTPEQDLALNQLQDREIAIAVASLGCQGDTAAEIEQIEARYEAEFVEQNRATLESIGG